MFDLYQKPVALTPTLVNDYICTLVSVKRCQFHAISLLMEKGGNKGLERLWLEAVNVFYCQWCVVSPLQLAPTAILPRISEGCHFGLFGWKQCAMGQLAFSLK